VKRSNAWISRRARLQSCAGSRTSRSSGSTDMTVATAAAPDVERDASRRALGAAVDWLVERQSPDGWWKGEPETNVTMDAEDLLLRHTLGILTPELTDATAAWIRSQQRADGTWATFYGGPADLSTTVEAYVALRLAGDAADAAHLSAARAF